VYVAVGQFFTRPWAKAGNFHLEEQRLAGQRMVKVK
jgi:hypothetical protein